jgi:hypothetical protein
MTGFLNHLAGRAIGLVPMAQPRIPARFDPALERSRISTDARIESSNEADSADHTETNVRAGRTKSHHTAEPSFLQPEETHPQRDIQSPKITSRLQPQDDNEICSSSRPPRTTGGLPHIESTDSSLFHAQVAHESPKPTPMAQAMPRPELFEIKETPDHSAAPKQDPYGVFGDPPRVPSANSREQQSIQRSQPSQDSSSSAPVVRITIGRVDVRADFAASTPAPASRRPRPSTLSLNEYLNQRGQGRR